MSRKPLERMRMTLSRIFIAVLAGVVLLSTSAWEESLVSALLFMAGCGLVAVGIVGRTWCALYIAGYKTQTLITTGPYSLCRNPLYLFSFMGALGVAFATETFTAAAAMILVFSCYYPMVIRKEESRLREVHGSAFDEYFRNTPSFLPKWSAFREADTYTVNATMFRRNVVDTMWFLWIVGILELVEKLHEVGILPVYWIIY